MDERVRNLPEEDAGSGEGVPHAVELRLDASSEGVLQAAVEAVSGVNGTVECIEADGPRGRRYRVAARVAHDFGPVMLVYDIVDAGGGVTRVRVTQCGFGDAAAWDDAFGRWRAWTVPASDRPANVGARDPHNVPAGRHPDPGGAGVLPWSSPRRRDTVGQRASDVWADQKSVTPCEAGAPPALVSALAAASSRLLAKALAASSLRLGRLVP